MRHHRLHRPWVLLLLLSLLASFVPIAPRTATAATTTAAPKAVSVKTGYDQTLVTLADGTVWAWGQNCSGYFGNGTRVSSPRPVRVPEVEGMTLGEEVGVGVKPDGTVWTWGGPSCPTLTDPMVPQQVPEISGAVAVANGYNWKAALMPDGTVWTWGANDQGQLGTGQKGDARSTPAPIPGLTDVTAIAANSFSGLALRSDGTVWQWGYQYGSTSVAPAQVAGLTDVVAVAPGGFAVRRDGTVWAWGPNMFGTLGNGTTQDSATPVQVTGLSDVVAVSVGDRFVTALKADGTVWTWGTIGIYQLPTPPVPPQTTPVQVAGIDGVVALSSGGFFTVAIRSDGTVWSWGVNGGGQLGDGTTAVRTSPVQVAFPETVDTTAPTWPDGSILGRAGFQVDKLSIFWPKASDDTGVLAYRIYKDGQLLDGISPVTFPYDITGVAPGTAHTLEVRAQDRFGNLSEPIGRTIRTLRRPVLAAGQAHSLALMADGTVAAWGANDRGQLGLGITSTTGVAAPALVPNFRNATAVAAGDRHSVALKNDGFSQDTVYAWGANNQGQLGGWNARDSSTPAKSKESDSNIAANASYTLTTSSQTTGINSYSQSIWTLNGVSNTVAVAAGRNHALALDTDGTVWAWGGNESGQLGDRTQTDRTSPVRVYGLGSVLEVAAGDQFSLALRENGTVWAWGLNTSGQTGDGSAETIRTAPVQVPGLTNIVTIAAGRSHALAATADGQVFAWGYNDHGQVGDGTTDTRFTPVPVAGLTGVVALAGGERHSLARTADGRIYAWGANDQGQLGDGTFEQRLEPVQVLSPGDDKEAPVWPEGSAITVTESPNGLTFAWTPATDNLAVRQYHMLLTGGWQHFTADIPYTSVWGIDFLVPGTAYRIQVQAVDVSGNVSETLTTVMTLPPPPAERLTLDQAAGDGFTLALRSDKTVWAWGDVGGEGIGDGVDTPRHSPIRVAGLAAISAIAAGTSHALALAEDGTVWAWGNNASGQLGDGTTRTRRTPVPVMDLPADIQAIAAGGGYSLALDSKGQVWKWGSFGPYSPTPTVIPGLPPVTAMAAGPFHALFLTSDGTVMAMGSNQYGQIGDGSPTGSKAFRSEPVQVSGLTEVKAIAAGYGHSLAVRADGTVWAWGQNDQGQLGIGTYADKNSPVQVAGMQGVTAVAAGTRHTLALTADGTLWGWGSNTDNQLGLWPKSAGATPTEVNVTGLAGIAAGDRHSVVRTKGGVLYTFGDNRNGQLGSGSNQQKAWSYHVILPAPDHQAPYLYNGGVGVASRTDRSITIEWPGGGDNVGITGFRVYKNGMLIATLPGTTGSEQTRRYEVTNLDPGTIYLFEVEAQDAEGNRSPVNAQGALATTGKDTIPPRLERDADGAPIVLLAVQQAGKWSYYPPSGEENGAVLFPYINGDQYRFIGILSEWVDKLTLNGQAVTAQTPLIYFDVAVSKPTGAAVTYKLGARDLAGQTGTIILQMQSAVTLKLTQPTAAEVLVGLKGLQWQIAGTASEPLAGLMVVDEKTGLALPVTPQFEGKNFTATVTLPTTAQDTTYKLRVVGINPDGLPTKPDPKGADLRTVTVDVTRPGAPSLTSPKPVGSTLYINTPSLTLTGTVEPLATVTVTTDAGTFTKQADKKGAFSFTKLAVPEGTSKVVLTVMDLAGNLSEPGEFQVVRDTTLPAVVGLTLTAKRGEATEELTPTLSGTTYSVNLRGADSYTLTGQFDEAVAAVAVGKAPGVQLTEKGFTVTLTGLKDGPNSYDLSVTDLAGNVRKVKVTITVDAKAPTMTVSTPNLLVGKPLGDQQDRVVEFAGSANEKLQGLRVVDMATGTETSLPVTVVLDSKNPAKWKAQITLPAAEPATWTFRFDGIDLAGNVSIPDAKGKDQRIVKLDPRVPSLLLTAPGSLLIFTNGNDQYVTKNKLTISGTLTELESGIKKVMIGTSSITPPKGTTDTMAFSKTISLSEGSLAVIPVWGEDMAGNASTTFTVRALLKTAIKTLTAKATWSKTNKTLTIAGTTDKAFLVDDAYVAVVPLEITVKDSTGKVFRTMTLEAANRDLAKGTYSVTLTNLDDLPGGSYTVTVTATAPAEFPDLADKTITVKVTISR